MKKSKKTIAVAAAFAVAMTLASCGHDSDKKDKKNDDDYNRVDITDKTTSEATDIIETDYDPTLDVPVAEYAAPEFFEP